MRLVGLVLIGTLAGAGITLGALQALTPVNAQSTANPPPPTASPVPPLHSAAVVPVAAPVTAVPVSQAQVQLSFAPVVRATAPAVASIYARRVVEAQQSPFFNDPVFGQLFGDRGRAAPRVQNALGSGVILSSDGIIVTNFHVVGNADDIRVVLNDRREFAAQVILQDEESDLAVLRLDGAHDLPAIQLADSDRVEVGDLVLAIGNPFGVGQTVSSGIVSALARSGIAVGSGRGYFIQTDAAINPGNSGGALVDMQGHLVGINSAILTRSGGSNGIGFAIPANLVSQVVAQAEDGQGRFQRPWIGMTGQAVDAALADGLGMGMPQGVAITALHPDSPLVQAGLRAGDVVLAVDGEPVNSPQEMMFRLAAKGIGGSATLDWQRGTQRTTSAVSLIAPPETPARNQLTVRGVALRGLVAETINPAVAAEQGLDPAASGVVVVEAQDIAARAGLQAGDVLVSVNRIAVNDTAALDRALRDPARYWEVEVLRDGRRSLLRFRL
ncbi:Do family serine endopeptidase [Pararhodobacter zhoushanensis]|uniref:Do family serine endopeptidase n=1 Tax=Pararhodobacter zhoushanensis TaxID=2479545 RepID=UPI000F8DD825|nr:Do family serine endopeptidase [Pararhodobacter zhoushanensis]